MDRVALAEGDLEDVAVDVSTILSSFVCPTYAAIETELKNGSFWLPAHCLHCRQTI